MSTNEQNSLSETYQKLIALQEALAGEQPTPPLQDSLEGIMKGVQKAVTNISAGTSDASDRFKCLENLVKQILGDDLPDSSFVPDLLSLATTAAVCRINQSDFLPSHLDGSFGLIQTVIEGMINYDIKQKAPDLYNEIGTALDLWSQATGIALDNPTGRWHVQMDSLSRGWRRPRVGRAYWTTTDLPVIDDYMHAILRHVPDEQKVLCLAALVGRGMNRELAFEIANRLGSEYEDELAEALAVAGQPKPITEYPPLVEQALSLSRSVMKLTQNLVTGEKIPMPPLRDG